jgi:hypothetical protein
VASVLGSLVDLAHDEAVRWNDDEQRNEPQEKQVNPRPNSVEEILMFSGLVAL